MYKTRMCEYPLTFEFTTAFMSSKLGSELTNSEYGKLYGGCKIEKSRDDSQRNIEEQFDENNNYVKYELHYFHIAHLIVRRNLFIQRRRGVLMDRSNACSTA